MKASYLSVNIIICIMYQLIKRIYGPTLLTHIKNVDNLLSEMRAMQKNPQKMK